MFITALCSAQDVIPGKLKYYSAQEISNIAKKSDSSNMNVKLQKYENEKIAKAVGGNNNVKLKNYDNEKIAKAVGGNNNVKLKKYDNEKIAKAVGGNNNVKLKRYETKFNVNIINKQREKTQSAQYQNSPPVFNNGLSYNGKNQINNKN